MKTPYTTSQYMGRPPHPLEGARIAAGLTVDELCQRSQIKLWIYNRIVNHGRALQWWERQRYADALGCGEGEL